MKLLTKVFVIFLSVIVSGCASYSKLPDSENKQLFRELAFLMREKPGFVYTVKKGDTLWSIANKHDVEVNQLIKENQKIISDVEMNKSREMNKDFFRENKKIINHAFQGKCIKLISDFI